MTAAVLTIDEAATALACSRRTVYRMITSKELRTVRIRSKTQIGGVRIPVSEIQRLTKLPKKAS